MAECKKCGFKYSSYCIGCPNVKQGLNLTDREYTEYLKTTRTQKEVNELTDEQIIKALEFCIQVDCDICDVCPLHDKESGCLEIDLRVPALNLIKRQKTEIKQKDIEIDILIRKKESLRDEIRELQSEVERLKEFEYMYNSLLN